MREYHMTILVRVEAHDADEANQIAARLRRAVEETEYKVMSADVDYEEA